VAVFGDSALIEVIKVKFAHKDRALTQQGHCPFFSAMGIEPRASCIHAGQTSTLSLDLVPQFF
jgi:hypothetical protein